MKFTTSPTYWIFLLPIGRYLEADLKNLTELHRDPKEKCAWNKNRTKKPGGTGVKDVHWSPAPAGIPAVESTLTGRQVKTTIPTAHHNAGQVQRGVKQVGQQRALNNYVCSNRVEQ